MRIKETRNAYCKFYEENFLKMTILEGETVLRKITLRLFWGKITFGSCVD